MNNNQEMADIAENILANEQVFISIKAVNY